MSMCGYILTMYTAVLESETHVMLSQWKTISWFENTLSAVMMGKNVTEAVICLTRALMSKLMSFIAFSGGGLHKPSRSQAFD